MSLESETKDFPIGIGLHQNMALQVFVFTFQHSFPTFQETKRNRENLLDPHSTEVEQFCKHT